MINEQNFSNQLIPYKIRYLSHLFGIDPAWALAIAETESTMGLNQKSPTGARGVFQMTSIAMKDLLFAIENHDDEIIDIACGVLFLRLLLKRWGTIEEATNHFCDPDDREKYIPVVIEKMEKYKKICHE